MNPEVFELRCAVQNYIWGKVGSDSEVAKLKYDSDADFTVDENKHYAELWMGTHPSGMSYTIIPGLSKTSLADWLKKHPKALGKNPDGTLPYLFKILSVNIPLSIQAHPDKNLAKQLHEKSPDVYKDPNHKPEIAIAITPFEALCGFRPIPEIVGFLQNIPEFAAVAGPEAVSGLTSKQTKEQLKTFFTKFMTSDAAVVKENLNNLVARISKMGPEDRDRVVGNLLTRLNTQFPGDVGCFGAYLFNYVQLQPDQAIYLAANEPHAYLQGDCVECMACSDNVVRAGLTPKFKDVPTLCSMLTYESKPAKDQIFPSTNPDQYTMMWRPPVQDFAVAKIQIPKGVPSYTLPALDSASIVLIIQGSAAASDFGLTFSRGKAMFISAGQTVFLDLKSSYEPIIMFRAFANNP